MIVTSFVPRLASLPTEANASGEWETIQATCASVSAFWTTVGTSHRPRSCRERRADGRHAAVAGERVEERGLLARDVCARALPHAELDAGVGAEHEVAREVRLGRLAHRSAEPLDGVDPLAPHGDDRLAGADRVGRDQQPFDDEMRVALRERPVAERAGIGTHEVRDDDLPVGGGSARDAPLLGGREAGSAAAAKAGGLDFLDHRLR